MRLCRGLRADEIAELANMSPSTVEWYSPLSGMVWWSIIYRGSQEEGHLSLPDVRLPWMPCVCVKRARACPYERAYAPPFATCVCVLIFVCECV